TVTDTSGGSVGTQTARSEERRVGKEWEAWGKVDDCRKNAFTGTVDVSSNKTCTAGCVESAAFSAGVLASHSVKLTQAGSGALVKVVTHGGIYGTARSGVSNRFSVTPVSFADFTVTDTSGGSVGTQTA